MITIANCFQIAALLFQLVSLFFLLKTIKTTKKHQEWMDKKIKELQK